MTDRNGEIPPPTEQQLAAMREAWRKQDAKDRTNPNFSQRDRDAASQTLLERSTNSDSKTDSER